MLELLPAAPDLRVPEPVTPARLLVGQPGDPQEPIGQRQVVHHERHLCPIVYGGHELITDRGGPDVGRDRFRVVPDPQPRPVERLLPLRCPLLVVDGPIGLEWAAPPDALEVIGNPEVRLRLCESLFQGRRVGFGTVGRCVGQDVQRLLPPFRPPEVVGTTQRGLDGRAGLLLPLFFRGPAVGLLLVHPEAGPDCRPGHDRKCRNKQHRCRPPPGPLHGAFYRSDRPGTDRLAL